MRRIHQERERAAQAAEVADESQFQRVRATSQASPTVDVGSAAPYRDPSQLVSSWGNDMSQAAPPSLPVRGSVATSAANPYTSAALAPAPATSAPAGSGAGSGGLFAGLTSTHTQSPGTYGVRRASHKRRGRAAASPSAAPAPVHAPSSDDPFASLGFGSAPQGAASVASSAGLGLTAPASATPGFQSSDDVFAGLGAAAPAPAPSLAAVGHHGAAPGANATTNAGFESAFNFMS